MKLTSMVDEVRRLAAARAGSSVRMSVSFQRDDARLAAQPRMQLTAADIDGIDAARAAREQHLGEAAGRGADVEADAAARHRSRK